MLRNATTGEILTELRRRAQDVPALEPLLPTYEALLQLGDEVEVPSLKQEDLNAQTLLEQSISLLQDGEVPLMPDPMAAVWVKVCDQAAQQLKHHADRLAQARKLPKEQPETWLAMMGQFFRNGELETQDQQEKDLMTFLLVHTWRPFLKQWASALRPLLEDVPWKRARCPICGGQPDIAYMDDEQGSRHLVCARCDTDWRYQRLGCPFCGNQDSSTFGYYPGEEGVYRLYVCGNCHRYLKTLDMREAGAERLLMVERIATIAMDLSALQAGYQST